MEVGKLGHSHSQPGEMDRTPPGTPKKGGKMLAVRVQMLDDTVTMFQVQAKALGRVLFDQVCNQLNLLESDYFGLEYQEVGGTKYWLDLEKPLCRQIGLSLVDTLVRFCVKFYTPDPSQLEEEFTRYLFCLQIKRDLSQGLLLCNNNTAALMASYIVQAECGDYVVEDYPDHRYLSSYKFVPSQDQELERRIMENHKKHAGQTPAEADLNLLETARRCELYGIKMHPAKDHESCPLNLAVAHMGIVVFQNNLKINTFSWAKIRKISFKRKRFLVKLHPEGYGYYKDTVEFFFEGRNECKNFWKKCVENHGFFRCTMVKKVPRQKTRVLSRGSSFRYSGRTQKQIVDFVRENYVKRQTFQRSQSFRHSSSAHSSVANVGTSISAHPLLPLGDNAVAGTPASLSCGSMTLTSSPVHTADIHAGASPSPPLTTSVSPGTSVTSSPQHFYLQETPFRRAGHRPARAKCPPMRSRHAISPLLSPTDVATAASNRSANHSNGVVDSSDITNSRNGLKADFVDFNDVYSNLYTLRSLGNPVDSNTIGGATKTDIFSLPCNSLSTVKKTSESGGCVSKKSKFPDSQDNNLIADEYTCHRSSSCKELYREVIAATEGEIDAVEKTALINQFKESARKCYSTVTSKNLSIDRSGVAGNDMRVLSSSYPGTTCSLSTELPDGEFNEKVEEVLDTKYDSQEEIALSHDDISHDSYELLERELDDYNNESSRNKRSRIGGDNERTRSCSWGSERDVSPLDFRSSENLLGSGFDIAKEQNFWSKLEREKSLKHKSEIDFRSFNRTSSKESSHMTYHFEGSSYEGIERKGRIPEFLDYDVRLGKKSREANEETVEGDNRMNHLEKRIICSKGFEDKELIKGARQEMIIRRASREGIEDFDRYEMKRCQGRRKSVEELTGSQEFSLMGVSGRSDDKKRGEKRREKREREERFHEGIKEKKQMEWGWEKERHQISRRESIGAVEFHGVEEPARKITLKSCDYTNFQEIHFKKFDRVVSNQFGKYPEFLTPNNTHECPAQEKNIIDDYEKACQVSSLTKELKKNIKNSILGSGFCEQSQESICRMNVLDINSFGHSPEFQEWKKTVLDLTASPKVGRVHVERTKSDPYSAVKSHKRNVLKHQKSIDLTPQQSEETTSENEDGLKKMASRSEHDIPYILHKRHCMNGTARNPDVIFKTDFKTTIGSTSFKPSERLPGADNKMLLVEYISKTPDSEGVTSIVQKPYCGKAVQVKKTEVEIINLDTKNEKNLDFPREAKKIGKLLRPLSAKKPSTSEVKPTSPKSFLKREIKKFPLESFEVSAKIKKDATNLELNSKNNDEACEKAGENDETIYGEVRKENITKDEEPMCRQKTFPPELPKRTSLFFPKPVAAERVASVPKTKVEKGLLLKKSPFLRMGESPIKAPCAHNKNVKKPLEAEEEKKVLKTREFPAIGNSKEDLKGAKVTDFEKSQSGFAKGKQEVLFSCSVHQRREESLTLFARTRLGLSEGSAFAPIVRQGHVGSPSPQRRAKSLDAPYVSVHSLPPADAFSSKDDTLDGNESDIVDSAVAKFKEFYKGEVKNDWCFKNGDMEGGCVFDGPGNTESEVDSVFTDDLEMESNFKKIVENQSRVEISFSDEKVLDGVRGKRLLSKIESVDFIDSEGDMDSSKLAEPLPIPSDRLVNLPESIRFPSVRQISGQTSEESADGWEQREMKVKRRTPRRSVSRDEQQQDVTSKESVVWDSKDDEPPDGDVWDDNPIQAAKYHGVVVNVGLPAEYLKRGSCGQSIDDDNLSTPMKESSPEHWVSVDDLPEALEREEKLLKQQEKILREKILNEKLKRELNLDTIYVDERYYGYRDGLKRSKFEEESTSLKENFKGHSLDTYELNEKKLRERGGKNSSLDEELLPNKLINNYRGVEEDDDEENLSLKPSTYEGRLDYFQCRVVKDVAEIDQFGDNDEELEEFFVVLDENLDKNERNMIWDDGVAFRRTLSKEGSLIPVPEEFKDVEKEDDDHLRPGAECIIAKDGGLGMVEIRLSEAEGRGEKKLTTNVVLKEKLNSLECRENEDFLGREKKWCGLQEGNSENFKRDLPGDMDKLSPFGGSRRGSEDYRKLSLTEDTGRLSPYDNSSRRSSDDPRRFSASEDVGRLSPFSESRRGSDDPRGLSISEESRKCSVSESVSEETRRRLSSTEETRRKRASLTKQCSVGAESLSDEVVTGIQECSSSFEHDEKDVFETEAGCIENYPAVFESTDSEIKSGDYHKDVLSQKEEKEISKWEMPRLREKEVFEETSTVKERKEFAIDVGTSSESARDIRHKGTVHLAPPTTERELSRETEDSIDYGEEDLKDIREAVRERDISEGLICENEPAQPNAQKRNFQKLRSSLEKSESLEGGDELRYIDDKRGNTPDVLMGKSREALATSIVVVNEGISVLKKINEKDRTLANGVRTFSLGTELEAVAVENNLGQEEQSHVLSKSISKPKPLTPKPAEFIHRKLSKTVPEITVKATYYSGGENSKKESVDYLKGSLDSSQESDLDRLSDLSLVSHVQNQIARRNLSEAGKCLRRDEIYGIVSADSGVGKTSLEDDLLFVSQKNSSEDKEKTESSSFELKSSADELCVGESKEIKREKRSCLKFGFESSSKGRRQGSCIGGKEKRSPDQEKRDSGEDASSSSSAPLCPKRELSSTWKPFLLESSGSSSLEEGWLPPDENAHLADEEETSSTSNNQQDDSYHDDVDYPAGIGYPVLNMASAEMMVGGYGSVYALSRTLSRISERSISEQERSDLEDDITKPTSRSGSVEEESIMSSDHQPSLSSDPPSPKEMASTIPDLPVDNPIVTQLLETSALNKTLCEPFGDVIPPPLREEDWPSPPSSISLIDAPVVSHVETFYMEIHPEEACKVVVAEPHDEGNSSSDENQTLLEESEFLHLSSDISASTTTTTQDGTVVIPVRPMSGRTGSLSEDVSMISTSDWSSPTSAKSRPTSTFGEDACDRASKASGWQDRQLPPSGFDSFQNDNWSTSTSKYRSESYFDQDLQRSKKTMQLKPLKLSSPTGKIFGFFETPVSKVRSPTSQMKFFEGGDKSLMGYSTLLSPTSLTETTSPKNYERFFDGSGIQTFIKSEALERRIWRSPTKGKAGLQGACTPYYSNVADSAEKSYFGRYDTGSLERTKIQFSRKCCSYYSVSRTIPNEGESSNGDRLSAPSPNTIPRASKKTKRRHRVAMDLVVRDGKIVTPPKTKTTIVENSDSDQSSPKNYHGKEFRKKQSDV